MWRRRLAWSLARGMAAAFVLAVACGNPAAVPRWTVHTPAYSGWGWATRRYVMASAWRPVDPALYSRPAIACGPVQVYADATRAWDDADFDWWNTHDSKGWRAGPFRYRSDGPGPDRYGSFRAVWVPTRFVVAVLLAPLAMLTVRRLHRGRRYGRGLCPACGYDLRASPGRCPECGAVPARNEAAAGR